MGRTEYLEKQLAESKAHDKLISWAHNETKKYSQEQLRALLEVIYTHFHGDGEDD